MPRQLVKHHFLVFLWGYLWKPWEFASLDWVEITSTNDSGGCHSIHWGPEWNKKAEEGQICSLCLCWASSPHLRHLCFWYSGFWTEWMTPPAFLALQLAQSKSWDFSTSIIMWANSYNKPPLIFTSVCAVVSIFSELWLIHSPFLSKALFPSTESTS